MNTSLEEQLKAARTAKNNDLTSYVWKTARNANHEQSEVKLIDATEEQLNKYYQHCKSMLYNKDKNNPGRYTLLNIIKKQRTCCNVELFLHWLENTYKVDERREIPRGRFYESVKTVLENNPEAFPKDRSQIRIKEVAASVPFEFEDLPVNMVLTGCIDGLGAFNKKHMTLKFITNKLGLWFTQKEMNEFTEEAKKACKSRIELVKERCGIPASISISVKDDRILNFKEFRALIQLGASKKYSVMTVDQLLVLRDKGLYCLEEEVRRHIEQWENLIAQIDKVAEFKGFTINK